MTQAEINKLDTHALDLAISLEFGVLSAPLGLDQARKVEVEIFNRRCTREYIHELSAEVDAVGCPINLAFWRLLHAWPEQRCRAALKAVLCPGHTWAGERGGRE